MNTPTRILLLTDVSTLAVGTSGSFAANPTAAGNPKAASTVKQTTAPATAKAVAAEVHGRIVWFDAKTRALVVDRGTKQETIYLDSPAGLTLDGMAGSFGDLKAGNHVMLKSKMRNGRMIADSVAITTPVAKSAAAATKPAMPAAKKS